MSVHARLRAAVRRVARRVRPRAAAAQDSALPGKEITRTEPPRPPCAGLWDTPMVQVNGDLTTCCLDEGLENRLGNITVTPLAELWQGETVHRWRVAHAEGRFEESGPLCTRCNWRSAGAVGASRIEKYLADTGEPAALARYRRTHRD